MPEILAAFDAARRGAALSTDTRDWNPEGLVDGYWFGDAGIARHHQSALAELQATLT